MQANDYLSLRSPILFCGIIFMFFASAIHAQEKQQALMPGTYRLNLHETPLYYIPHSVFRHYSAPTLHMQTVPFQKLLEWGTQFAIVSRDTTGGELLNSIVFLNAQLDTSVTAGFVSQQTEPLYFQEVDSTMQLNPTYGKNPLERRQNGTFNLQENWFSLYYPHIGNHSWKDMQDENKLVSGTSLTIETAAFDLFRSIAFEQIIYNENIDSIPLYAETDTLTPPQTWFQSRENIFVHKDSLNGLWLKVSRFKLVPFERRRLNISGRQPIHNKLEETIGWIRTEDRYRGQWERHITEQPRFRFEVRGADVNIEDHDYTRGMLAAIKVIDIKSNQTVQIMTDIGAEITNALNRCLHFVDANFDGHPDIMADFADGGASPNYSNIFYLFDPVSKQFVYDDALSELSQVEVDPLHQVIRSAWRNGAGQHGAAEYRFINGKLEQTYQWDQIWGAGYFVEETESVRQPDGQWKPTILIR